MEKQKVMKKYFMHLIKVKPIKEIACYLVKCPKCKIEKITRANPFRCSYCMKFYYIDLK